MSKITNLKRAKAVPISSEAARAWKPKPEETARIARMESNGALAASAPLPGPLRDAFASDPQTFFGIKLQPVTGTHIAALVKLKNKFIDGIRLGMAATQVTDPNEKARLLKQAEDLDVQPEDMLEAFHVFTLTPDGVRKYLAIPDSIRSVPENITDTLPPFMPDQLSATLSQALGAHYLDSFKTALNFEATETEGKKKSSIKTSIGTASAPSSTPSPP